MAGPVAQHLRDALSEKIAESLEAPIPPSTPRRVPGAVDFHGKATAVVGMRRAGKTTFAHQQRARRLEAGAAQIQVPYVNFEDERLGGMKAAELAFLIEEHGRLVPDARERGTVTWCFDEIQVVSGWERFVRRLLDTPGFDVIVTGSSAALLSREIATALRGRAWEVPLYPFGFAEALEHQGHPIPKKPLSVTGVRRAKLERAFLDWLEVGGFPEAQRLDGASRRQLLKDYVDVAMLRDVMERHAVTNVLGLRWLVRHLLGNAAGLFSVEKFYAALKSQGIAISKDTVHQLLAHLEDCFLIRTVWLEADSERQRMVNPRKAYPVDQGLIPVFDRRRSNRGHALETAVLIELQRRRFTVTYVRTPSGKEVDFLARSPAGELALIQVCADASDPSTAEREHRALVEAMEVHSEAKAYLLTLTRDAMPRTVPEGVTAMPAYAWMLGEQA